MKAIFSVLLISWVQWIYFIHLGNLHTINIEKLGIVIGEHEVHLKGISYFVWKSEEAIIAVFSCFQSHKMEERLILFSVISGSRASTAVLN